MYAKEIFEICVIYHIICYKLLYAYVWKQTLSHWANEVVIFLFSVYLTVCISQHTVIDMQEYLLVSYVTFLSNYFTILFHLCSMPIMNCTSFSAESQLWFNAIIIVNPRHPTAVTITLGNKSPRSKSHNVQSWISSKVGCCCSACQMVYTLS